MRKIGSTKITINAAATANYNAATYTFILNITKTKVNQTITVTSENIIKELAVNKTFSLGAKAKTVLKYTSSNSNVVTVNSNGVVTMKGVGTAVITIQAVSDDNYRAATKKVSINIIKERKTQTLTVNATTINRTYFANRTFQITGKAITKIVYSTSDPNVVTIDSNGLATIKGTGTATITVTAWGNSLYKAAVKRVAVNIYPRTNVIQSCMSPSKGTVKLTWAKNTTASGYQLQMSTDKDFSVKLVANAAASQTSTTVRNLKSGTVYYFRIRNYKVSGGKVLYTAWSNAYPVIIK